jgi:septum formation topological specificity factor MinE
MVDASERLQVLLSQEASIYRTSDYLARMQLQAKMDDTSANDSPSKKRKSIDEDVQSSHSNGNGTSSTTINKHWREKICEWAYQGKSLNSTIAVSIVYQCTSDAQSLISSTVVDHFDLTREVVSIAMNHLDRFLGTVEDEVDKNMFQLLAMTCLYLSIKLNEYKHLLIPDSTSSMDTILRLSRGAFTLEQMEKMEYEVLQRLRWHVHPPSPQLFVKHFLFFLSVEEHEIHDLTQFMIELSVMDYFFVSFKPSEVAIAALLNALDRLYPLSSAQVHLSFLGQFLDLQSSTITACRERLSLIYAQANDQGVGFAAGKDAADQPSSTMRRTTSPVSVMAAPQSCESSRYHHETSLQHDDMDYAIEEEDYDDL